MRRFLTIAGTTLLATALLMGGTPAKAASLSWTDPAGDPTTAGQGTWDITRSPWTSMARPSS